MMKIIFPLKFYNLVINIYILRNAALNGSYALHTYFFVEEKFPPGEYSLKLFCIHIIFAAKLCSNHIHQECRRCPSIISFLGKNGLGGGKPSVKVDVPEKMGRDR